MQYLDSSRYNLGPTIETERLIMRPPSGEDLNAWAEFMNDVEAAQYIGGACDRSMAWRGLCTMIGSWVINGFGMFSIIEKSSGKWLGRVGPWQPADWPGTEVGWGIARYAWGKGFATEAAKAAIDWAFEALGWNDVIHVIDVRNTNSQAVAKRLGSRMLRAQQVPQPYNNSQIEIWGQSKKEWQAHR